MLRATPGADAAKPRLADCRRRWARSWPSTARSSPSPPTSPGRSKRRGGNSPQGDRPRQAARLDVHLDVASWLPEVVSIADGESEAAHARAAIVPGAVHVYDRGIFSFELVAAHFAAGAHFVHRIREPGPRTPRFEADEELPLSDEDRAAGVLSDRLGHLAGSQHREPPTATATARS